LTEISKLRLLGNRLPGRIFGPKRDEVTEKWTKLRNEELNDLYCSPNIIRIIKSKRLIWARQVECMGKKTGTYKVLEGKPERKSTLERPILKWIFKKWDGVCGID
jgi:predicted ATP-grasp superfamily ATP-dependent carboligase